MSRLNIASYSRIKTYEECPLRAKLAFIDKIPEPERDNEARDRGDRIHKQIEDYIKGESEALPTEVQSAEHWAGLLRELYPYGQVRVEQAWYFDQDWNFIARPSSAEDWSQDLFLCKLDALLLHPEESVVEAFDWKTGKKQNNEVKHMDQLFWYGIATLMAFPDMEKFEGTMVYVDHPDEELSLEMHKDELSRFFPRAHRRLAQLRSDQHFRPKPSVHHCMWCPYKTGELGTKRMRNRPVGTGHCNLNP